MVWNGNAVTGQANIAAFIENLPKSCHTVKSLDAQPVLGARLQFGRPFVTVCTF